MSENIDLSAMSSLRAATSYTSTSLHEAVKLRMGQHGMEAIRPQTIPQFFRAACQKFAELPALVYEQQVEPANGASASPTPSEGVWTTVTYSDYYQKVKQAALILLHVGMQPHSSVGILAFNCPEWFYAEFGALRAGGVLAGIYPSSSVEAVFHVLDTSDATVCVVDDAQQMAKVRAIKGRLPRLRAVLQLHGPYDEFVGVDEGYYKWHDLEAMQFSESLMAELQRREADVRANECAMLIYTSGTVGMPKGVMLSHDAIVFDAMAITNTLPNIAMGAEVIVTYLPLNHIAAQVFDVFLAIENGGCVYFADRNALKGTLARTLIKAKPTRLFAVPRVFEKIQEKLNVIESKSSAITKYFLETARATVENYHLDVMQRKPPCWFKYWVANCITGQVKSALGLERCKSFIIGGAPVTKDLKLFFLSLDMPLNDVYGMSETSGAITMHVDLCDLESVGKAVRGSELKIHNPDNTGHGEICVRGRTTLMGYLNDPEKTKETLKEDGWLHTGDIGYIKTDGSLLISGRIKELIITAGGENIPPAFIEELIKREMPWISNAMVVGDHKKYLTVLLTLKTDIDQESGLPLDTLRSETIEWLRSMDLELTKMSDLMKISANLKDFDASNVEINPPSEILVSIEEGIKRANKNALSNAQKVQKFSLLPHDFSIPTGELGPTLKVRRNIVHQKYASLIARMYK